MAFHVDGGSSGLGMQRGLAGLRGNDALDAGKPAAHHAARASGSSDSRALAITPRSSARSARNLASPASNLGRDHDVAGLQRRIEAAGHAKADDAAGTVDGSSVASRARNCIGSLTAADDDHAGPGSNAGLLH